MKILHVASITNNKASGMSVVIPKHVKYQGYYAETALLNLNLNKLEEQSIKVFNLNDLNRQKIINLPDYFSRPDLVVLHGIYYIKYLSVYKYLRKNKIPYILVPHGCLSEKSIRRKYWKKKLGLKLFFNKIILNAKAIQYLSKEERETSLGNSNLNFISYNGIELDNKVIDLDRNFNKEINFIYVGRISIMHKGLDLLIEAINIIQEDMRKKNMRLNIYGPDLENERIILLNLCKKYKIDDIVAINDAIYDENKKDIIRKADVFIQTSRWEGQPIGILEAMSLSKAILATEGTNMADEIKENKCGWKAKCNSQDIAEKILKVYEDRNNINKYSLNSKKLIEEKYTWDIVAKKTLDEYKKVINS